MIFHNFKTTKPKAPPYQMRTELVWADTEYGVLLGYFHVANGYHFYETKANAVNGIMVPPDKVIGWAAIEYPTPVYRDEQAV